MRNQVIIVVAVTGVNNQNRIASTDLKNDLIGRIRPHSESENMRPLRQKEVLKSQTRPRQGDPSYQQD
jgi:hypothetical protein